MKTKPTLNHPAPVLAILSACWPLYTGALVPAQELELVAPAADLPSAALILEAPSSRAAVKLRLEEAPVEIRKLKALELAQQAAVNRQMSLVEDIKRHNPDHEAMAYGKANAAGDIGGRTLVVPAGKPDPKMLLETEEDLEVMAHLLEKSMNVSKDGGRFRAAGIDLFFSPGSFSAARNLYLAGHGALFLLPSPIPLKPIEAKGEDAKKDSAKSSAWDEARRELYRGPDAKWIEGRDPGRKGGAPKEVYDEQDVDRLKASVLDCLKEAANMRHVAPNETISVVVTRDNRRGGPMAFTKTFIRQAGGNRFMVDGDDAEPNNDATLLIRVAKSSVDALAAGSMTSEQFKDKAVVVLY